MESKKKFEKLNEDKTTDDVEDFAIEVKRGKRY
jgi:hypothetical protein